LIEDEVGSSYVSPPKFTLEANMELYLSMLSAAIALALSVYGVWASGQYWLVTKTAMAGTIAIVVIVACYFVVGG